MSHTLGENRVNRGGIEGGGLIEFIYGNIDIRLFKYIKKMVRKNSSKDPFSNLLENLFQKAMIIHVQKCFFKTFETHCINSS